MLILVSLAQVVIAWVLGWLERGPIVIIGNTTLVGRTISDSELDFFGGIPYAEPPVGSLRLRPPFPKDFRNYSVIDATKYGYTCLQTVHPVVSPVRGHLSEDCLTINVLRPSGISKGAELPVMVWIYGGGFSNGEAIGYDGNTLVQQSILRGTPVIYVNFHYRLGPLGFPQGREAERDGVLNLGLKDQIVAMQWIQNYIHAFGGDKNKVTIFGQSAGSISIAIHLLHERFSKLARAAILESGSASSSPLYHASRNQRDWQNFVQGVSPCSVTASTDKTMECLRSLPANSSSLLDGIKKALASAEDAFPFRPVLDGHGGVLRDFPSAIYKKSNFASIPFLAGSTLDEGTIFTPIAINSSDEVYRTFLMNYSPPNLNIHQFRHDLRELLRLYPNDPELGAPYGTGNETFGLSSAYKRSASIYTDILFEARRRFWSQTASKAGIKNFGYLFTDPQPLAPPRLGVFHGAEVPYVFGQILSDDGIPPSAKHLSRQMMDYWISFASSLDPNDGLGTNRPYWHPYTSDTQGLLRLDRENISMADDDHRADQLDFIISHPVAWRL